MNLMDSCDLSDIFADNIRFLSHLLILHIMSCLVDENEKFGNYFFLRSVTLTVTAITIYHLFVKKIFDKSVKNMRAKCQKTLQK